MLGLAWRQEGRTTASENSTPSFTLMAKRRSHLSKPEKKTSYEAGFRSLHQMSYRFI